MMARPEAAMILAAGLAVASLATGTGAAPSPGRPAPGDFSPMVDNPWFPLAPGTTLTYTGRSDGKRSRVVFEVTDETALIDGVPCVVVHDRVYEGGRLVEDTIDWYTQDADGNVWYFGEDTATFDGDGRVVSTEGTWKAGVDGARPGIFMPADPAVGQAFQQESYPGHAEDRFVVLLAQRPTEVPFGAFDDTLVTLEWTVLEPDVLSEKVYARGVGMVSEADVRGGDEVFRLVRVDGPASAADPRVG